MKGWFQPLPSAILLSLTRFPSAQTAVEVIAPGANPNWLVGPSDGIQLRGIQNDTGFQAPCLASGHSPIVVSLSLLPAATLLKGDPQ